MSTRRALLFSFMDRYAGLVVSIGSSMVIARLLTPAEIGMFSVAMVMLSFLHALRDFGAGQYLVQEAELTTARIRAVWALQLGTGLVFCAISWIGAEPIARYYNQPHIENIMRVIALNFAIGPFGSITYAWLIREMRFGSLAVMRFSGNLVGAVVSVSLAWKGFGPISLAFGSIASTVMNALIATVLRPAHFPWLPGTKDLRKIFSFGTAVSGESLVTALSEGAPDLLLGKFQTMTDTGVFSRATGLVAMFSRLITDAVHTVAFGALAREVRNQGNVEKLFIKATSYLTALGWPFSLGVAIAAEPLVLLLYGNQWQMTVPLVRWMCLALAISLPATFCSVTLIALGKPRFVLKIVLIDTAQRLLFCVIGAAFGVNELAVCLVFSACLGASIWLAVSQAAIKFQYTDLRRIAIRSGVVGAVSAVPMMLAALSFGDPSAYPATYLLIFSALGAVGFLLSIKITSHPIYSEIEALVYILRTRFFGA